MMDYKNKTLWIIGASSGIGRALAVELSSRGAQLILSARSEEALKTLSEELGGRHQVLQLDVTDQKAVAAAFGAIDQLDSTVYLAAAYTPGKIAEIGVADTRQTIAINLEAAFTLLRRLLPYYRRQGYGQIALCGSVAGYKGLPGGQPYSATKAAITNLAESLRSEVQDEGIDVKLISPGFVKTPLTDKNDFDMPMMITPEQAARYIADGLLTKRFEIHFPKKFTLVMKLIQLLPYGLYFSLAKKINR